ncbi:glycosyltransferase family 25 protein [Billgrantia desiderata]|uniref:glycosyltransferase family 25 protein n=1 Tax=Billgrantia desiderata TaxID=52021 RepID=UPI00089EFC7E|nr:glycosyltransferase family 25 protein [Halomonas desiderata]SEG44951.1 glycosyl transferase, family 25 [Halomonas desiderata]
MSSLPPVTVISLPGSPRRARVQAAFDEIGLPFEFHDAVNGAELNDETLASVDQAYAENEWGHGLNKGEIGCAISHIQLYERMVEQGLEEAIILEDDAQPVEGFRETLLTLLARLPTRAELVFLYHGKAKGWPIKRQLANGHKLVRYRYPSAKSKRCIIGACGYWISQSGAQRLVEMAYPIRMPADYLTGFIQRSRLKAYGVEPNLLTEAGFPSEIDAIEKRNYGAHLS